MTNAVDGGEAILEAFRNLGVDYVISSPGSEWPPVWEAFARQKAYGKTGPIYMDCGHEGLAVNMATGYTQMTGRLQAVLLHAGTGLLHGSMAIHGAMVMEVPIIVMSGESLSYGEDPDFEPGVQWQRSLSVVGGPQRLVEPLTKWASQATSIHTVYQSTIRAGEMAQRTPKGPTYLCMPMETMMQNWTPPARMPKVEPPPRRYADPSDIEKVASLIRAAKNPIISTAAAGRDPEAFAALVALADLLAIPVVESRRTSYANFPKNHALYIGSAGNPLLKDADLVIAVANHIPFYPPRNAPTDGHVVVVSDNPVKTFMVYQNLQADHYLEGDLASSLRSLAKILGDSGVTPQQFETRRARWKAEHQTVSAQLRDMEAKAPKTGPVDPIYLCTVLRDVMPNNTIYVDETTVYGSTVQQHLPCSTPQSFFRTPTGLGQGFGIALGIKLAARDRPVVLLTGDGSFLYNPVLPALGAAKTYDLPLLVIVFNNGEYKAMKRNHLEFYPDGVAKQTGSYYGNKIEDQGYEGVAAPFAGAGWRVQDAVDLPRALSEARTAMQSGKAVIVNVVMSR